MPVLPAHARFFAWPLLDHDRLTYSSSMLLDTVGVDAALAAVAAIWQVHESLRLRFPDGPGSTFALCGASSSPPPVEVRAVDSGGLEATSEAAARDLRKGLDIERGPLTRFCVIEQAGRAVQLLVCAHHLCSDGMGAQILLSDLARGITLAEAGSDVVLRPPSASLVEVAAGFEHHARSAEGAEERRWWREALRTPTAPLPCRRSTGVSEIAHEENLEARLLLPGDRLLTARRLLAGLLSPWRAASPDLPLAFELRNHGRRRVGRALDLRRIVAWLSTSHPVIVPAGRSTRLDEVERDVAAALAAVPHQGHTFEAVRSLGEGGSLGDGARDLVVNPMSGLGNRASGPVLHQTADASMDQLDGPLEYDVSLTLLRRAGSYHASWWYDHRRIDRDAVALWQRAFGGALAGTGP
jgi:hypothetical protein